MILRTGVLGFPVALLLVLGWTHRWNSDDAFINFRVVDQLVHGNGPVFNLGERVEAYTSTLWVVVLAIPAAIVGANHVEWIAVSFGLGMSVAGLAAATWAAALLNGDSSGLMIPLGALVFAVLSPSWDFATSGLETGLGFGWLGTCYLGLVLVHTRERWRVADWRGLQPLDGVAFLAGLGPLVRPDFALFGAGFLLLAVVVSPRPAGRAALRALAFALPLPVAYQLFRMGYFAELVPNTALAKEAGRSGWDRGLDYLWDTVGTYALYLPVIALLGWLALRVRDDLRSGARTTALLHTVPPAMGLLHLLYIVKVGGDFMHGRFVLPGVFAILMPVAAIPVRRRLPELFLGVSVVAWAVICGLTLRTSYHDHAHPFSPRGFIDERRTYVLGAREAHPVTLGDYRRHPWELPGELMRQVAARQPHLLTFAGPIIGQPWPDLPTRADVRVPLVAPAASVGMFGYAAGRDVWVVDLRGLGDPVAARIKVTRRGVPGHEKLLGTDWVVARFARAPPPSRGVADARRALGCGDLRRTLEAVTRKMTLNRFVENLRLSASSTRLRVSADPREAERTLCH
jgi:arabinofuranosyltransferase